MSPQSGPCPKALAFEAAQAATTGGTAQGAFAMKELAKLAKDFHDSRLQLEMAKMTLDGLRTCETHAQTCVKSLVQAIAGCQPQLAQDAAWALMQLLQKCASAGGWAKEAGALEAVKECLKFWKGEGGDSFAWLAHAMGGLQSILDILKDLGHSSNVADLVWIIYNQSSWKDQHGEEAPCCRELVTLLVHHLNSAWQVLRAQDSSRWRYEELQVVHATVAVLQQMAADLPSVASQLVEQRILCSPLFAEIVRDLPKGTYGDNAKTSAKCCKLLALMASSRSDGASLLRKGVQTILLNAAQQEGLVGEAACGALPWLVEQNEFKEVLYRLAMLEINLPSAKRLRNFVESLWLFFDACDDSEEELLKWMPELMHHLVKLRAELQQGSKLKGVQDSCFQALCGATKALVPMVWPGRLKELDTFISIVVQELKTVDLPGGGTPTFEMLVNELGQISHSPPWRSHLRELEVDQLVVLRMNQARGNKRAMKYSIWLASSLRGLPFLAQELQQNVSSYTTVDAVFCTLVDILDEDVEGEWFLRHQHQEAHQQLKVSDLSHLMHLVLQGMQQHQEESYIQARGCHCLALVLSAGEQLGCGRLLHLSQELLERLLEVCVVVLSMSVSNTLRDGSFLLRTILEPSTLPQGDERQKEEFLKTLLVQELCSRRVPELLVSQLNSYAYKDERHSELLEGLLACLVHLGGVSAALGPLIQLEPSGEAPTLAKACGLKVLFEMGSAEPTLLLNARAAEGEGPHIVMAIIRQFVEQDRAQDSNLRRHAELLYGLCQGLIERAHLQGAPMSQ